MLRRVGHRLARLATPHAPVASPVAGRRPARVAAYGPLPPAPTGIASYHASVLAGLDRIGFTRHVPVDPVWPVGQQDVDAAVGYPLGVFQMGNNPDHHLAVYRAFWGSRGLLVLHDLALDDFVRELMARGDALGPVALREALGGRGRVRDQDVLRHEPLQVPWCAAAARRARGIVVHSEFGRRYLHEIGCRTPIFVVPHPAVEDPADLAGAAPEAAMLRAAVEGRGARALVIGFGDVNATKQFDALVAAAARLDGSVHVAIVGRRTPGYELAPVLQRAGLGERVMLRHDVTDAEFRAWLVAADIVVDLRHPHRGEVSGSLIRAQQAGKAAIVSATGTYLEVPPGTAVHVAPGPTDPVELAAAIQGLIDDADGWRRMGDVARAHIERQIATEAVAHGYADAIQATLAIATDPAERAGSAWARRLAELGVSQQMVLQGYGVGYERALRGFMRSSWRLPEEHGGRC